AHANGESPRLGDHFWPTENTAFLERRDLAEVLQPTVSGRLVSAKFGCVRNDGYRFHEGVDLKATVKDKRGEALDEIYAFERGVVRYVNLVSGKSSFGRYIVIEHPQIAPGLVTTYAHLRRVPENIVAGREVAGGELIGTMGRSASYTIPRSRAHLHFEIGLWLGSDFQKWFDRQPGFSSKNEHGAYNGMNIIGYDSWDIFNRLRDGDVRNLEEYLAVMEPDVRVRIAVSTIPAVLRVNPDLMTNEVLPDSLSGWDIDFAWYGAPMKFTALSAPETNGMTERVRINVLDFTELEQQPCADMVRSGLIGGADKKLNFLLGRLFME
ncbi:MAG: M23 family metallopeptidase, partial [Verrucomicrobiota bacterium]